ncbi:MAG TPA: hypothetical protein VGC88_09840 [Terriglobales bacterium]
MVTVAAGSTVTGVNITVKPPTTSPPANVTVLGVVQPGSSSGSAFGTGDTISRGTTSIALVFGAGLNASQKVTVGGPADITVSSVQAIKATDNTPGLQFELTVSPTAALGARSVYITSTNGDVTGFVGGLEVTP